MDLFRLFIYCVKCGENISRSQCGSRIDHRAQALGYFAIQATGSFQSRTHILAAEASSLNDN